MVKNVTIEYKVDGVIPHDIEHKLDEADRTAAATNVRYTEEEVFSRVRERIHGRERAESDDQDKI
jgi:hypothetical protein